MSGGTNLPPAARQRLVRFCGMLGSDHDGERANAARMADRLIREAGLTWDHVIAVPAAMRQDVPKRPAPPPEWSASEFRTPGMQRIAEVETILRQHRPLLTQWEVDFLGSIASRGHLTIRQLEVLERIRRKVKARGAA
ncbi:hypothetical protein [Sediminicoccus rosea]|uniref:Uncharacterized protein n=1 Tax=Sediminicoccus rosea TaxID=1225128 RepID=A0ABZ0PKY9_9PROT|nr:hypothetical protein [Sediminicoccus rosea]WPB86414.1 hypothetical protein R9Z33_05950 [Sediminicoccus rosea]